MAFYGGAPLRSGDIAIGPLTTEAPRGDRESWTSAGGRRTTLDAEVERWTAAARERDDVFLFEVSQGGRPIGQIFLHDMDGDGSLVGYHLFDASDRDRGVGTEALRLLVRYVAKETDLARLVIITAGDNTRSRRVAEKNGFVFTGPPREDPSGACLKLAITR